MILEINSYVTLISPFIKKHHPPTLTERTWGMPYVLAQRKMLLLGVEQQGFCLPRCQGFQRGPQDSHLADY